MFSFYSILEFFKKYGRQIFAAFAANMGAFAFGTAWSWTATALPSMKENWNTFETTTSNESLVTAILFLGCIVSSPISSFCIERFGRRSTMMLANLPCVLAWVLIGIGWNIEVIYIGRFIIGICTACFGSSAPLYVSESSNPKIRGSLVCSFDSMIAAGMVFINIVGAFTNWRTQAFVCAIIPIIGHFMLLVAPESPRFLLENGRQGRGRASLSWLNPTWSEKEIEEEMNQVIESCAKDKSDQERFGWRVIFESSVFKPILIGSMLMFFHQFSGNYPILAYGVSVFSSTGTGNPYLGIAAVNTAQLMASIIPLFLVDKLGRRFLLITSEVAMAFTLAVFGLYFYFQADGTSITAQFDWLPITALIIYEICYSLGIGPVPWLLSGELVSPKMTGVSLGIITCFYRVLGFGQLYFFHDLMTILGQDGIYYFFAGCCLVGALSCYSFVPDTTGKSLDEIHNPESYLSTSENELTKEAGVKNLAYIC